MIPSIPDSKRYSNGAAGNYLIDEQPSSTVVDLLPSDDWVRLTSDRVVRGQDSTILRLTAFQNRAYETLLNACLSRRR